ncbi:sulfite exporter TauE/SafE family protein, partial [Streptomyces sp. MBT57]|nr:sulfite exporter TauE/SafE family protein [Streptomyces sp. MBT57]
PARPDGGPLLFTGLTLASIYGGYFTAAQGIIYLSLMGMLVDDTIQRLNAVKNVLAAVVNSIAALFFLFVADFDWTAVVLIAVGSAIGGQIGAKVGRRLSPTLLRALIVVVGTAAIVQLLLR